MISIAVHNNKHLSQMNTYTVTCITKFGTAIFAKDSTSTNPHEAARSVNRLARSKKFDPDFLIVSLNGEQVAKHVSLSTGTIICP